jgi:hypothetical protein
MDITEQTEKCTHPPCKCTAPVVGDYCSEHCEDAEGGIETECKCGHPDCG